MPAERLAPGGSRTPAPARRSRSARCPAGTA